MNEVACMKNSELCANKELVFKEKCGKIKECWQQIMQLNLKFQILYILFLIFNMCNDISKYKQYYTNDILFIFNYK